jgi:hydroxymethylpyrimidine/phosphomethylpyrimidine kinase
MKHILTIAGSDSGGGAGIQADIKTITVLGGYAMSAVTAITAQNTRAVSGVHPVPGPFVSAQIESVLGDIGADAVKTGMLYNEDIIAAVAASLGAHSEIRHIVVDPVMKAASGDDLLRPEAVDMLTRQLFPLATVLTPNVDEAEALTGKALDSAQALQDAARQLHDMGPNCIIVKGGHRRDESSCTDLVYDGSGFTSLAGERIDTPNTHGTGCAFSAALAAGLAGGLTPAEAAAQAKSFITDAIRFSLPLGGGHGPANPCAYIDRRASLMDCIAGLSRAFSLLQEARIGHLIPEVQSNFGYCTPAAAAPEDVVGFPARIIRRGDSIHAAAPPEPGGSRHIARIILTAFSHDRRFRSAMNIAWSPALIDRCKAIGYLVYEFDRSAEPADVKQREGATLEWGTQRAITCAGRVPDIVFDRGDFGKEPMIRVLGTDPADVASKIITISS